MKSLFEQMVSTYREENGYLIPNLILPDEEQVEIGIWGQRQQEDYFFLLPLSFSTFFAKPIGKTDITVYNKYTQHKQR